MTIYLRQSTASQEVPLGFFVDSTDGNTEETALTIAAADIRLHKAGATTLATPAAGATHISNGIYYWVADATDTNTVGSMSVYCHPTGALAVRVECVVLTAQVYDSLIAGSDLLDVSTTQLAGQAVTAAAGVTFPTSVASPTNITAGTITTATNLTNLPAITANWLTAAGIAAGALDGKGNWNIGKTGYTLTATTGLGNQTADITGSLSGSVGSVTGAVGSVTGNVGGNVTGSVGSVTAGVNVAQISGSTAAADNLEAHALRAVSVTFSAGGTTTTAVLDQVDGAAASATDDVYNGRVLVFSAPSGLKDQATSITDYVGATKTATIVAVTASVGATATAVMV